MLYHNIIASCIITNERIPKQRTKIMEKRPEIKDCAIGWLAALLLAWGIFALALFIAVSQTWVYPHFASDRINERGLSEYTMQENYRTLIRYSLDPRDKVLEFQGLEMSDEAEVHFEEVKQIFKAILISGFISLGAASALGGRLTQVKNDNRYMLRAVRLSIGIVIVGGIAAAFFFDDAFVLFHKLLFSNDYWIFDRRIDPIIDYLPESFFRRIAIFIGGVWLMLLCILRFFLYPYHHIREKELRGKIE